MKLSLKRILEDRTEEKTGNLRNPPPRQLPAEPPSFMGFNDPKDTPVDSNADIARFSDEMEMEPGSTQVPLGPMVDNTPVEKIWGGPKLGANPGEQPPDAMEFYRTHGINEQEWVGWVNRIREEGFTPEIYKEIESVVGDMDNFMNDVQHVMPGVYDLFQESGLEHAIPHLPINPKANTLGKQGPASLSLSNAAAASGQASWDELRDRGDELRGKTPPKRGAHGTIIPSAPPAQSPRQRQAVPVDSASISALMKLPVPQQQQIQTRSDVQLPNPRKRK